MQYAFWFLNRDKMRKVLKIYILCCVLLGLYACNQRYWYRKKATIYEDTTRIEKNFQIVW